jgi:PAS domain S-box-containing protein
MSAAEALIQTALLGEAIEGGPALVFVADEEMRYIAVNRFACESLGYTREALLALRVADVAKEPEAPGQFDEMLASGFRHGTARLTRSDGSTVEFSYRAGKTTVAGLGFFVSVGFVSES